MSPLEFTPPATVMAKGALEGFLRGLLLTGSVTPATIVRLLDALEVLGVVLDREWILNQGGKDA